MIRQFWQRAFLYRHGRLLIASSGSVEPLTRRVEPIMTLAYWARDHGSLPQTGIFFFRLASMLSASTMTEKPTAA